MHFQDYDEKNVRSTGTDAEVEVRSEPEQKWKRMEEAYAFVFSVKRSVSEHLLRFEDNDLRDKYDHNFFEYIGQPTGDEFLKAVEYQKERGDTFIKLAGDEPLQESFGLTPSVTLTMELKADLQNVERNPELQFFVPSIDELEGLEVSHYGLVYGECFTRRNIRRLYEKLRFHGAYLDNELVGSCYTFSGDGFICLDGLLVDIDHRHQRIATSLIAHVWDMAGDKTIYLHADKDSEVRQMYEKLGFREVGRRYEYLCTDLIVLKGKGII